MVSVSLIVLYSQNPDASLAFYRKFGIEFTREKHGGGPEHYSARLENIVFELYPEKADAIENQTRTMIGLAATDPDRLLKDLIDLEFCAQNKLQELGEKGFAILKDPGGNRVMVEKRQ